MKTLNLFILTKNKKALRNFFKFFFINSLNIKFNFIKKVFIKKLKKTKITLLKSPHVNKSAQEHFEILYISKQIKIQSTKMFKFLIFLKKLKISLFPDISIRIKLSIDKKLFYNSIKKNFNLNKFFNKLYFKKFSKIQNLKKKNKIILLTKKIVKSIDSKKTLQLFDIYGKQ